MFIRGSLRFHVTLEKIFRQLWIDFLQTVVLLQRRFPIVQRDGLDACVYQGIAAPVNKAPPPSRKPKAMPGEEYESSKPLPPIEDVVKQLPEAPSATGEEPREAAPEQPSTTEPEPADTPTLEAPAEPSTPPQ